MFTRLLASGVRRAAQPMMRVPSFSSSFMQPLKMMHMETTNLLMKSILVPANLHVQNLLEFLEKCEQELESKSEVNSLNQLSLLSQDTQAGLTKQPLGAMQT